ncbi:hypothetical protein [uncultured Shewanella sp.]|uniref:hypothetical protein n=1 Tax=uncultured Shewanella sp. TaxID=173975 RepID=UPI00262D63E0|nr:hypothetical protein [uncultured Shewanella sp.]
MINKVSIATVLTSSLLTMPACFADDDNDVTDYLNYTVNGMIEGTDDGTGESYNTADDGIDDIPGNKISSITIYDQGKYLTGIKIDYLYGGSVLVGNDDDSSSTIELDASEFINYGTLRSYEVDDDKSVICGFTFTTSDDNEYELGNCKKGYDHSGTFSLESSGYVLYGLAGTVSDDYINTTAIVYGEPLELEYSGIEFDTDVSVGSASTGFLSDTVGINNTNTEQSATLSVTYSETDSSTDSYSSTAGITEGMSVTISEEVKSDAIVSVSSKWSYTYDISLSYSETVGETTTESSTSSFTDSSTLNVSPMTITAMKKVVYSSTASFPYTITYTNPWDGKEFYVEGSIDNATAVSSYVEWIDVGYVDDDGCYYIDEAYQDDYGDMVATCTSTDDTSTVSSTSVSTTSLSSLNLNSIKISEDDTNWQMSDEEIQFRQENGITD